MIKDSNKTSQSIEIKMKNKKISQKPQSNRELMRKEIIRKENNIFLSIRIKINCKRNIKLGVMIKKINRRENNK